MLLSEWRKAAPNKDCLGKPVLAVLKPVLADLGADGDPECWISWGDDPQIRYLVLAPTVAGLIDVNVRLNTGADGPRATGKLIRWSKLQVSELSVEATGGHRLVAVQLEGQVLKGMDDEADRICEFVRGLIAGIDGRNQQPLQVVSVRPGVGAPGRRAGAASTPPATKVADEPDVEAPKSALRLPAPKAAAKSPTPAPKAAKPAPKAKPAPGAEHKPAPKAAVKPKVAEAPGPEPAPWVAPHPIGAPAAPAVPIVPTVPPATRPPVARPVSQPAAQAAAALGRRPVGEWAEIDQLHEQPADRRLVDKPAKDNKPTRPRPWTP